MASAAASSAGDRPAPIPISNKIPADFDYWAAARTIRNVDKLFNTAPKVVKKMRSGEALSAEQLQQLKLYIKQNHRQLVRRRGSISISFF